MSYKRIVKKKGKNYGPYIYESYRDENGKVRKRYLGKLEEKRFSLFSYFFIGLLVFLLFVGSGYTTDIFLNDGKISGRIFVSVDYIFSGVVDGVTGLVVGNESGESMNEEVEHINEEDVLELDEEYVDEVAEDLEDFGLDENEVNFDPNETIEENNESDFAEDFFNNTLDPNETIELGNDTLNLNESKEFFVNESNISEDFNESLLDEAIEENRNLSIINNNSLNDTIEEGPSNNNFSVSTLQYRAVIGRPVKWIKKINATGVRNLSVDLPRNVNNISVLTGEEVDTAIESLGEFDKVVDSVNRRDLAKGVLITGNVASDIKRNRGFLNWFWRWLRGFTISGNVILEEELVGKISEKENQTIVDVGEVVESEEEIAIEYYTEAPQAEEVDINDGKRVVVYASDELNYSDILSYVIIDELNVPVDNSDLKLYWYFSNDSSNLSLEDEVDGLLLGEIVRRDRVEVSFDSFDFDNDGIVDYIEWVVPHLSAQVYEIVIEIYDAEKLDANRTFVENIYDEVKAVDDDWVLINDSEFVRVYFEENLTSANDITVYARSDESSRIEVYLKDGNDLIAEFENISSEGYYKKYLGGLVGNSSEFDLKVFGSIEFDYVVDPIIGVDGGIEFVSPTPINETISYNASVEVNVSINSSNLANVTFNWNGTNISYYDNSLVGFYNLDNNSNLGENDTLVFDGSGYVNGTIIGGGFPVSSGKYGGGYYSDGSDSQYIDIGRMNFSSDSGTIMVWAKRDSSGSYNYVFGRNVPGTNDGDMGLYWNPDNQVSFFIQNSTTTIDTFSKSLILDQEWHHLVAKWNTTGIYLYIDGELNDFDIPVMLKSHSTLPMLIGESSAGDSVSFNGTIDELRLYNRSLSDLEISEMYNSNLKRHDSSNYSLYIYKDDLVIDNYTYYSCASDGIGDNNCTEIRILEVAKPIVNVSIIYPTDPFNVTQDEVFAVTLNVSCVSKFCGDINTSIGINSDNFIKYLGGSSFDFGYSVIETSDNGFVITGITQSYGGSDNDIILSKFNSVGNELWTKTIGGSNTDYARDVIETSDGGLVITGYTQSYGGSDNDIILSKFNSVGNELWTKTIGGSDQDYGYSVIETSDGGLVVTGYTESYGLVDVDIILSKFNSTGNELWTKTILGSSPDYGYSVIETSDGGLVVTGYTQSYGGSDNDIILSKFNSTGNELWTKTIGGSTTDIGYSVIETSDGGFVLTGMTQSYGGSDPDIILSKFNSTGNELWTKTIGGSDYDYGYSVIETSDGGLVITGYTQSYGGSDNDIILSKFNSTGNELWTKTIGGSSVDIGYSVIETSDGGFVLTGMTQSYGGSDFDIFLARLDSDGGIYFNDVQNESVLVLNQSISESSQSISESSQSISESSHFVIEFGISPETEFIVQEYLFGLSGIPFFVNMTNPNSTQLDEGESFVLDWWLNSSGSLGTYELISYLNLSSGSTSSDFLNVSIIEIVPNDPVILFGTNGSENVTSEIIFCNFTADDPDGDVLNISVDWYLDGVLNQSYNYTGVSNGTDISSSFGVGNTTKGDNWSCSVRFYDPNLFSNWVSSVNLTIENDLPVVNLITPSNWSSTTDRLIEFNWTAVDDDNDSLTYDWNLTEVDFVAGNDGDYICDDDRGDVGFTDLGYNISSVLKCFYDQGYYYTWRVRAYDGEDYGEWSEFGFNVTADISFNLANSGMAFGTMQPGEMNDTTDDFPSPFLIDSVGNALVNISVNSSSLWSVEPLGGASYQMKASNVSGEAGAFSWIKSLINWFDAPINANVVVVSELNYTPGNNSVEVDVNLTVPDSEISGVKSASVIFTSGLAE